MKPSNSQTKANSTSKSSSLLKKFTFCDKVVFALFLTFWIFSLALFIINQLEITWFISQYGAFLFALFTYALITFFFLKKNSRENFLDVKIAIEKQNKNNKMTKRHWSVFAIILVLITLFTSINFGTTKVPETWWENEKEGQYVILEVPEHSIPGELFLYAGISDTDDAKIKVYTSKSLSTSQNDWTYKSRFTVENGYMYRYESVYDFGGKHDPYIILYLENAKIRINEVFLLDDIGFDPITLKVASTNSTSEKYLATNILDEQYVWEGGQNNENGMYFDEVYHAAAAFEYINGWEIQNETTHPILGKLIISLGILMFGMNPFGWRIMGVIFSLATVVLVFFFAKKLFKKPRIALAVMVLSCVEGLRFTLGRIATIDTFALFFILLSFYFMYNFYEKGFDMEKVNKSLVPFALAGIFFGFAVSVKWTGLYAGLGLLILLIFVAIRTIAQFIKTKESIKDGEFSEKDKIFVKKFPLAVFLTIVYGLVFFVAIPFAIYFIPYAIHLRCGAEGTLLEIFIREQKDMFSFHGGLRDSHTSASAWWSWPLNGKSVYVGLSSSVYNNLYSRVHIMQTTFMSLFGVWTLIYFITYLIKTLTKIRRQSITKDERFLFDHVKRPMIFLLVGFFSTIVPWFFILRSTYQYHYYQPVTFLVLLMGLYLYMKLVLERKIMYSGEFAILNGKHADLTYGNFKLILVISLAVINFLMFLPVFTGIALSSAAAMFLFGWANGFWGYGLL